MQTEQVSQAEAKLLEYAKHDKFYYEILAIIKNADEVGKYNITQIG
jgi:hypothetical protein